MKNLISILVVCSFVISEIRFSEQTYGLFMILGALWPILHSVCIPIDYLSKNKNLKTIKTRIFFRDEENRNYISLTSIIYQIFSIFLFICSLLLIIFNHTLFGFKISLALFIYELILFGIAFLLLFLIGGIAIHIKKKRMNSNKDSL